jgi:hypothetical protein
MALEVLEAEARAASRVDFDHTGYPESVRIAYA